MPGCGVGGVRFGIDDEEEKTVAVIPIYPKFNSTKDFIHWLEALKFTISHHVQAVYVYEQQSTQRFCLAVDDRLSAKNRH